MESSQGSWCGRTSRERSAATKGRTSDASSKRRSKSPSRTPLFLDLRKENGRLPDASWETDGASLGEHMMPNIGEFHNEGSAYVYLLTSMETQQERYCLNCGEKPLMEMPSKLSQILEHNPDPKYKLSQKACLGILRRAERRGKVLPKMLDDALRRQAGLSVFKNEQESPEGGKEILIQNERTGALSTLNNQSVCVLNDQGGQQMSISEDVSGTLRAQEHGHQPLVFEPGVASRCGGHVYEGVAGTVRANAGDNQQAVVYGIGAYNSEGMRSPNPHGGIYEADTARTLDLNGGSPACNQGGMAVVCAGFDGKQGAKAGSVGYQVELSPTLEAEKQKHVVCATTEMTPKVDEGGTAFSLRSRDYKDPQIVAFAQNQRDEVRCLGKAAGALAAEPGVHQQTYVLQGNMIGREDKNGPHGAGINEDVSFTLNATDRHAVCIENHPHDSRVTIAEDGIVQTLSERMGTGGGNVPLALCMGNGQMNQSFLTERAGALNCMHDQQAIMTYQECTGNLDKCISKGVNNQNAHNDMLISNGYIVRRLTPLECERLQGFPDGWTDIGDWVDSKGKTHKDADSPKYKALGNSIALPFWEWMAGRMAAFLPEGATMGSLFDGIGGFPLAFARAGVAPVWLSEIEEFCIAVTKKRFDHD